jgi:hypothetical protein
MNGTYLCDVFHCTVAETYPAVCFLANVDCVMTIHSSVSEMPNHGMKSVPCILNNFFKFE